MPLDSSVFRKPPAQPKYFLTINSEGLDRSGKTKFAFSAPKPLGCIKLDRNTDNVSIKEAMKNDEIYIADFTDPNPKTNPGLHQFVIPPREEGGKPIPKDKLADKSFYEKRWNAISKAYYDLVNEKSIRTIVIDTGSSFYEECRLARFGKLTQVLPKEYGSINKELAEMVVAASNCNLIIPHRLKKQYKNDKWDGNSYEGVGYNGVGYDCQITIRHEAALVKDPDDTSRKKAQFKSTIINCSQSADLMGLELTDDDSDFPTLAMMVYPEAPDEMWH